MLARAATAVAGQAASDGSGQRAGEVALQRRGVRRDHLRRRASRRAARPRARSGTRISPIIWLATSGIRRSGSVDARAPRRPGRAPPAGSPSRSSRWPGGLEDRRGPAPSSGSRGVRVVPHRQEDPQQPLRRAVGAAGDHRRRAPPAGRPAARARRRTGRPWCRSSGAPAPGRRRPARGDRADRRTREALGGERARAPRRGSPPGCRARPAADPAARAPGTGAGTRSRAAPAPRSAARANASDSAQVGARAASRSPALRVLISSTMCAGEARSREVLEEARPHGCVPRPGHQVLVLGRAGAVGQVDVPQPVAEPVGHRDRVGVRRSRRARGRWWCWRSPPPTGPSRAGRPPCRAAGTPATGTCSRPRTRCPVDSSRAAMPSTNPAA